MKRVILMLLAAAMVLTACGKRETTAEPPAEETVQDPTCAEAISETGDYAIVCEWEEYASDVERITFFVENHTEEPVETGVDFRLERLEGDTWTVVPMVENAGWVALGLSIPAGGRVPLDCYFSAYDHDFGRGGTYRIVKELNGQLVAGEFRMAEVSAISAQQPYGFAPLEELPEDFGASDANGNEVVFTGEWIQNLEAVTAFLNKSGSGVDCQLRTVQDYGEGAPMVIDVIYENDHFLWRMWNQGAITEQRFSYIVTDGIDLFLSNGVDWANTERYGSDTAFLIPSGVTGAMLTAVEQQAAGRLTANVARYQIWSDDGTCSAALTEEPTEFAVSWQEKGKGSRGEIFRLRTAVTALKWQPDGTLRLTCGIAGDDGSYYAVFDPVSWSLRDETN